ncbi:MAG: alpha/beta fold hydrolase [Salinivirgaceae bacterium]|nr:alpha/beta fold hydrolase [Salinivirgaceae bacterium]
MDITHHYIEKGDGQPLILLHGNGENCDYFCQQIDAFSKRFRVIALDTRGHGQTPRGEKPFTIRQFAADLLEFMNLKGINKSHILGFSDGANIAMAFAMKYPERVDRLILNGGNLDASGVKRGTQIPIEIGYWFASRFANKSAEAKSNAEMLGLMVNDPNIAPSDLSKITAPTLVIAGTRDMIKESHTRLIAANIPNAELAFVSGNHFIANKNPKEFNARVMRFLE